jgi:hypothetical protein
MRLYLRGQPKYGHFHLIHPTPTLTLRGTHLYLLILWFYVPTDMHVMHPYYIHERDIAARPYQSNHLSPILSSPYTSNHAELQHRMYILNSRNNTTDRAPKEPLLPRGLWSPSHVSQPLIVTDC